MKDKHIYLCEDSLEGILTAVYDAYQSRYGHDYMSVEIKEHSYPELFASYIEVETDLDKAKKVGEAVRTKISPVAYEMLHQTSLSPYTQKAEAIYRFLVLGFKMGALVLNHLSDDHVRFVMKTAKEFGREQQHLYGFVRFRELDTGIMFSKIDPKFNQLILIGPHFADRFPEETFIIYDERRKIACIHEAMKPGYQLFGNVDFGKEIEALYGEDDDEYTELWKSFVETVAIKERTNPRCQMTMMPKRFWKNMVEMRDKI